MANFLSDLFTAGPAQDAQRQAQQMLMMGYGQGTSALQGGLQQGMGTLEASRGYYGALTPEANAAWQRYASLVGGDPTAMRSTLVNMPGFQSALGIAQTGAERASAAGGMGASGNALLDVANISRTMEDQNYKTYADQLWRLAGMAPNIAGAQTGISGTEAGMQYGTGQAQANLDVGTSSAIANSYQKLADAQTQAASNTWNAILGIAGLGVKAAFPGKSLSIPLAGAATA